MSDSEERDKPPRGGMTVRNGHPSHLELIFEPQGMPVYVEPDECATLIASHGAVKYDVFYTGSGVLELYPTPHQDVYVDGVYRENFISCRYGEDAALFELENGSSEALVWVFEPSDVRVGLAPGSILVVRCMRQIARIELARMPCREWYVWVSEDYEVFVDGVTTHRGSASALTHREVV